MSIILEIKKSSIFIGILKKPNLVFTLFCFFSSISFSQVLVQYNSTNYNAAPFNSLNASACSSGLATFSTLGVSPTSLTPYGYCVAPFTGCGYFQITAATQAGFAYCHNTAPSLSTAPDYVSFTVTPVSSNCVYINKFCITMGVYSTGADKVLVGYSNDGGVTWITGPTWTLPHTTTGGGSTGTGNCSTIAAPGGGCATMALYTWNITPFSSATPVIFKIIPYDATTCNCTNGHNGTHEWAFTQVEVDGTSAPLPPVTITNPTACAGSLVNLTAAGASTYTWNTGSTANPLSVTASSTTYTVTGTSAAGCTNTAVTTITANPLPTVTVNSPSVCSGTSVNLTAAGANTYTWNTGSNANPLSVMPGSTSYTVTGTSAAGCTNTAVASITVNTLVVTATTTSASCGATNGTASASPTGGTAPYTYSWSPSGGNTANATGLNVGNYTVTIKDANTCTATTVANITSTGGVTASVASTSATCNATNGSATVTPTSGTAPYTYTWSPIGGNAATATGLAAGNYTVTIKDANTCTATAVANVTNSGGVAASVSSASVTCNGLSNGSATVTPAGGTAPYTYTWSPSGGNSTTASGLAANNYTVIVSDANSCTITATANILQPSNLSLTPLTTSVACNGASTGAATVTATGGTAPYTYTWSPSGGNAATVAGLAAANYSVTVSDAHSCTATATANIIQPSSISLSTVSAGVTCNGASTGAATVIATGGASPYTYSWSPNGGTNFTATNLAAGNYSVLVTDHNLCTAATSVTINQPSILTANTINTPATCGNANGTASVTASGGTPGYTYIWSPGGGNLNNVTGLAGGNYTVTIKDANNCTTTAQTTIAQTPSVNLVVTGIAASCSNANGTATAIATGGTGILTYTWSSGANTPSVTNLNGNTTYTVSASDALGCSVSKSITIGNHPSPVLSVTSNSIVCNGSATGSASVNINAGTGSAPFSYSWSPSGGANPSVTNLLAGTYTVAVKDSANCVALSVVTINQPTAISATVSNTAASCGMTNGSATVIATGGTPGYTYMWNPIGGNTTNATGLGAGIFNVTIKDANNCTYTTQTAITSNSSINLSLSSTPATCGLNNGTVMATVTAGTPSQSGYVYTWNPNVSLSNAASSLMPGVYSLTVEDSLQCITTKTITVGNKPNPILSVASTSVTCFGANTASATASVNSGTAPFAYLWSPGGVTNSSIQNLPAGNYIVAVIDSANCTATATISIMQPQALTVTPTSTLATCGNTNGMVSCNVSGGTPNYTYTWVPSNSNSLSVNNLAGNIIYTVTVSDANNCVQAGSVLVNQTSAITLSVSGTTSVNCFGASTGSSTVSATGGTPTTYTYSWVPNGGTNSVGTNLAVGLYTVSVVDSNLCHATTTLTIIQPPPINVSVNNLSICSGQTTSLTASVSGGNGGAVSYTWAPTNANTQTINVSPTATTTYVVIAQNTGCTQTAQASGIVSVYPAVNISITPIDSVCKGAQATLATNATGGSGGGFTYSWSSGQNTSSIIVNPSVTTSYTAWAHDALCPAIAATTEIYIYAEPSLTITPSLTSGCGFVCVSFTAGVVSNVPGNNIIPPYNWSFGDGTTASGNSIGHCYYKTGNYDVTLTAFTQNHCLDTLKEINFIHVHQNPTADFSASAFETDIYNNTIYFYNQSIGNIVSWNWNTDTTTYLIQNPSHTYPNEGVYPVTLIVTDNVGCKDTVVKNVTINPEYTFYAPNCVTPNEDGKNELFLPIGEGWDNNYYDLWIFDRWGNMIFHTTNPYEGWDSKRYNEVVQEDTYVWKVVLKDIFKKEHDYHGQVSVIR